MINLTSITWNQRRSSFDTQTLTVVKELFWMLEGGIRATMRFRPRPDFITSCFFTRSVPVFSLGAKQEGRGRRPVVLVWGCYKCMIIHCKGFPRSSWGLRQVHLQPRGALKPEAKTLTHPWVSVKFEMRRLSLTSSVVQPIWISLESLLSTKLDQTVDPLRLNTCKC